MTTLNSTPEKSSRVKTWGAAVILLMMVLMVFSTNIGSSLSHSGGSGGETTLGTASNGRKVTANDRARAANLIESLESIYVLLPSMGGESQQFPLGSLVWGPAIVRDFKQHPEALALLLQESTASGPGASPQALGPFETDQRSTESYGLMNSGRLRSDDVRPVPGSPLTQLQQQFRLTEIQIVIPRVDKRAADGHVPMFAPYELPPAEQERVYAAMRDFLTIQAAGSLITGSIKASEPMVDRLIAERGQTFALQVATFDPTPRLATLPDPTDAQLADQLKAFADKPAGAITRENPFGFGYRIGDRVKLEMISFKRSDVRKLVEAEKSAYDWEVDARMAFAKDSSAYAAQPVTTNPADAATQPATRPTFESVKAAAIEIEIGRAVDVRSADIERRIRSTMILDFQAWSSAQAQKSATEPKSTFNVPYNSGDYLDKLAADVQGRFKLLPSVARYNDAPRDRTALSLTGAFGRSHWHVPDSIRRKMGTPELIDGPTYAVQFARGLMPEQFVASAGDAVLEPYEPSETVHIEDSDGEIYIFRVTATELNHAATTDNLTALRTRLVFDWKSAEAQRLALADAETAAKNAKPEADLAIAGVPVAAIQAGPFGRASTPAAIPPALGITDLNTYAQFGQQLNDHLLTDPTSTPIAVLNVPLARRVYVARRTALTAGWTDERQLAELRQFARGESAKELAARAAVDPATGVGTSLAASWLNVTRIYSRNDWKAAHGDGH